MRWQGLGLIAVLPRTFITLPGALTSEKPATVRPGQRVGAAFGMSYQLGMASGSTEKGLLAYQANVQDMMMKETGNFANYSVLSRRYLNFCAALMKDGD